VTIPGKAFCTFWNNFFVTKIIVNDCYQNPKSSQNYNLWEKEWLQLNGWKFPQIWSWFSSLSRDMDLQTGLTQLREVWSPEPPSWETELKWRELEVYICEHFLAGSRKAMLFYVNIGLKKSGLVYLILKI